MNETEARWQKHAAGYDRSGPVIVPDYHEMHRILVEQVGTQSDAPVHQPGARVLDLGAGAGRLLERFLDTYPSSRAVWFDNAEMMQHRARLRLERFGERVSYVLGDFRQAGWESAVPGSYAAVVSSHAIHHATDSEKHELYRAIFGLLQPGGSFINADEVNSPVREEQMRRLFAWNDYVMSKIAAGEVDEVMVKLWEQWQRRVLRDPFGQQTEFWNTPEQHIQWLRAAGFEQAEVYWERGLWAVYGARKGR